MVTKVTVKSPDFSKWQKALNKLVLDTGLAIEAEARATAPRSEGEANSNHYMNNINYYHNSQTVIAENNYSACIEYGTAPHIIEPNEREALAFNYNGEYIVRKKVHHPGTKPNPVMRNAAAKVQKEIPQIWKEAQRENGL